MKMLAAALCLLNAGLLVLSTEYDQAAAIDARFFCAEIESDSESEARERGASN
jgi:hypothetical protein